MINLLNNLQLDKKKIILIIIVFVAVVYLDFTFVIGRQMGNINTLGQKITKIKKDLDKLSRDLDKSKATNGKQVETSQKPSPKVKKVLSNTEVVSLLKNISEIAKKDSVQIIQIKSSKEAPSGPGKASAADKFSPVFVILDLVSDYHHFGKFINDLENAQTFMEVQSFKINSEQTNYMQQAEQLTLKTYVSK